MLHVENVTRAFDGVPVLRGVNIDVGQGEIICLLGPSGCGKTTLLRIIAGLEHADGGEVRLNGESILDKPVHQRGFGLMFQDFALFPHMNVEQNVAFGLRMHQYSQEKIHRRVQEMLELVGLAGFERRDVTSLSGGERQRVALARSLAPSPRLLMLDEPLGSLDAALRERLAVDLRDIIKRVGLTAVYVTHDQREAFFIADRIALMNAGRIEQAGRPEAVYRKPETEFAARFLGLDNLVPVLNGDGSRVRTPLGMFEVPSRPDLILLHPLGIELTDATTDAHTVSGEVTMCMFTGDTYKLEVRHDSGYTLQFQVSARTTAIPRVGDTVGIRAAPDLIVPLITS